MICAKCLFKNKNSICEIYKRRISYISDCFYFEKGEEGDEKINFNSVDINKLIWRTKK